MKVEGKAIKVGDNIDTDVIIPGRYLIIQDPEEMAKHAMEGIDPSFPQRAKGGAILVAGKNFGCGSSREEAPVALKYAGVTCVLAKSFARIFFRNAINVGLPALEVGDVDSIKEGDYLFVDVEKGRIEDRTRGLILKAVPLPLFVLEIIRDGGLVKHLKKRLGVGKI